MPLESTKSILQAKYRNDEIAAEIAAVVNRDDDAARMTAEDERSDIEIERKRRLFDRRWTKLCW